MPSRQFQKKLVKLGQFEVSCPPAQYSAWVNPLVSTIHQEITLDLALCLHRQLL